MFWLQLGQHLFIMSFIRHLCFIICETSVNFLAHFEVFFFFFFKEKDCFNMQRRIHIDGNIWAWLWIRWTFLKFLSLFYTSFRYIQWLDIYLIHFEIFTLICRSPFHILNANPFSILASVFDGSHFSMMYLYMNFKNIFFEIQYTVLSE